MCQFSVDIHATHCNETALHKYCFSMLRFAKELLYYTSYFQIKFADIDK